MKKYIISICFMLMISIVMVLVSCQQQTIAPSSYENYNITIEEYFLARVEEDFYTMQKYLPEQILEKESVIANATENDSPNKPDMKENMGDKYSIKGFDYFYDEHGELYYLIQFYNFVRDDQQSLVFGIKDIEGDLKVYSAFGNGGIGGKHVTELLEGNYITISSLQKAMSKYPEHTFTFKEYPEA